MDEESGFKMHEVLGFTDEACRRVRGLLQDIHLLLTAVQASWKRLRSALDMHHEVSTYPLGGQIRPLSNSSSIACAELRAH